MKKIILLLIAITFGLLSTKSFGTNGNIDWITIYRTIDGTVEQENIDPTQGGVPEIDMDEGGYLEVLVWQDGGSAPYTYAIFGHTTGYYDEITKSGNTHSFYLSDNNQGGQRYTIWVDDDEFDFKIIEQSNGGTGTIDWITIFYTFNGEDEQFNIDPSANDMPEITMDEGGNLEVLLWQAGGTPPFTYAVFGHTTGYYDDETENGNTHPFYLSDNGQRGQRYTVWVDNDDFDFKIIEQELIDLVADFNVDFTQGDIPLTVQFSDLSTGNPSSWQWDFDNDGEIDSDDPNPEWTYDTPGQYTVCLNVSDGINTDEECKVDYIEVTFEYVPVECENLKLTANKYPETEDLISMIQGEYGLGYAIGDWTDLQALPNIETWISCMGLDDGARFMLTRNGQYIYGTNRQYFVAYFADGNVPSNWLVHDQLGNKLFLGSWYGLNSRILARNTGASLAADFNVDFTQGDIPLTVQFSDLSTGNPSSWQWDFDNDGEIDSDDPNPEWTYDTPGQYTVCLNVSDGINTDEECKVDYINVPSGETYFERVWATPFSPMNIYVTKATIDELNMVAGDEIGVFDMNDGEEICVGTSVLTEELDGGAYLLIIASMDDGEDNGFTLGNEMIFKLYSQTEGLVELVSATFPYPGYDEVFTPLGTATVELEGVTVITQTLEFVEGWNLTSMRTVPDDLDMLSIFNPLILDEKLVKVINQDGLSVEHLPFPPPNGQWSNTIEDWVIEQGYYVKVNSNTSLSITAPPVEIPLSIPLRQGWNMIGMPCEFAQSTETMLQPLIDDGIIIKVLNEQGLAIEHLPFPPPNGQWVYGFEAFEPGEGYYMKSGEASSMVFDCSMPYTGDAFTNATDLQFFEPVYKNNPYMPMSVVLTDIDNLAMGDEIAIYDNGICVGASVVEQMEYISIVVSMDDPLTEEVDGYTQGNLLSAVVWQNSQNTISDCELQFIGGVETFHPLETYIGKLSVLLTNLSDINALEMEFNVSPNPFISYTSLNYTVPENGTIEVSVFNMAGQVEMKAENNQIFAGNGKIRIDRSTLQAGSYILQITYSTVRERKTVNKKMFIK